MDANVSCAPPLSLQCLYCEKTFRDKTTLKDHMRKKAHRRVNASNRDYDRFYVINYLVTPWPHPGGRLSSGHTRSGRSGSLAEVPDPSRSRQRATSRPGLSRFLPATGRVEKAL